MQGAHADKRKVDLDRLEAEIRRLLKKHLPGALDRDSLFFFTSDHPPTEYKMPAHWIRAYSEELLQLSKESLALRRELVLPTEKTPGALFIAACEETVSGNPHRRGPRKLAKWLMDELEMQR